MKFTDIVKRKGLTGPIQKADRIEIPSERRKRDFEILAAPLGGSAKGPEDDYQYERPLPAGDHGPRDPGYYASPVPDKDFDRFQDRLRMGKVKICDGCGGVMAKSSRMILSPLSGFVVIFLGAGLMTLYGLATNFLQTPWFIKFALPAGYYVGSIFLGVGILFFFIREKIWTCHRCKEIRKR